MIYDKKTHPAQLKKMYPPFNILARPSKCHFTQSRQFWQFYDALHCAKVGEFTYIRIRSIRPAPSSKKG
jgi:hypothetical protein